MNKVFDKSSQKLPKFLKKLGPQYQYSEAEWKEQNLFYENKLPELKDFSLVQAHVIKILENEIILDMNAKSDAVIPASEFKSLPDLKVGDEVELYLEHREDKKGNPVVSRKKALLVRAWEVINEALDKKTVLQGTVKRRTKGGLIVDINGIETFLPGSQIDVRPVFDFDEFVGNAIDVAVVKIKKANNNVVVSHKVLIEKEIESQKANIINNLEKGQILEGTVKNITNFGVFVDLGGLDGLLHITDISWSKIGHPEQMFERGQKIKVVVIDFDESKKRISLGMKQLTPHPWSLLPDDIKEGSVVKGKIVNITDYGAFLEIHKGVEGLIHVSEMSWSQYVNNPKDYLKIGEEVEAVVLAIDRDEKRMSLGLKQLKPIPWSEEIAGKKYQIGTNHKGIVRNITNFGAFIELEPGIEGLLHVSDISWSKKITHASEELKIGEEVEVQILSIDIENKKMTLGIKQLEEDPWEALQEVFKIGSIHKGSVIKKQPRSAIVELPYSLEGFVPQRGLYKEDGSEIKEGEILNFVVLEFLQKEKRIVISHTDTFKKSSTPDQFKKESKKPTKRIISKSKSTLGDIEELSVLKEKLKNKALKEKEALQDNSKREVTEDVTKEEEGKSQIDAKNNSDKSLETSKDEKDTETRQGEEKEIKNKSKNVKK